MALRIDSEWTEVEPDVRPELDATYGRLGININDAWASEFESQNGLKSDRIEGPAYPLAEWIAENWWSLLYEPEKSSGSKYDPHFRARHWLGTAREGFALPDMWIYASGKGSVEIQTEPYYFTHSRLLMPSDFSVKLNVVGVESDLKSFVASVIERLNHKGFQDTLLHKIWSEFTDLDASEQKFCRLLGALGLSPYASDQGIEDLLGQILSGASDQVTEDFCDAADQGDIYDAADDMFHSLKQLDSEPVLDLSSLFGRPFRDNSMPWRVGVMAANQAREHFGINVLDPNGGTGFFDAIEAGAVIEADEGRRDIDEPVVHGSLRRTGGGVQMNLIRQRPEARRFDAARSCFIAWTQSTGGDRLVTRARVRDQQASRAFAAELLAPLQYIKSRASNNILSVYRANEIAEELAISPAVVKWQAENGRMEVVGGRHIIRN